MHLSTLVECLILETATLFLAHVARTFFTRTFRRTCLTSLNRSAFLENVRVYSYLFIFQKFPQKYVFYVITILYSMRYVLYIPYLLFSNERYKKNKSTAYRFAIFLNNLNNLHGQ